MSLTSLMHTMNMRGGEINKRNYFIPICRARIIHQHIQFSEQRHRLLHNAFPICCLGHVHLLEHDIFRIRGSCLLAPLGTDIRNDDLGAFRGEALRDGGAETGSGSCCYSLAVSDGKDCVSIVYRSRHILSETVNKYIDR